jgi:hypothetical protein
VELYGSSELKRDMDIHLDRNWGNLVDGLDVKGNDRKG